MAARTSPNITADEAYSKRIDLPPGRRIISVTLLSLLSVELFVALVVFLLYAVVEVPVGIGDCDEDEVDVGGSFAVLSARASRSS
jgi:hypothetical protein